MKEIYNCFPYGYGDNVDDNDERLSTKILERMKSKDFQRYLSSVCICILVLGSVSRPAYAIPPEAGEFAARAAGEVNQQLPDLGDVGRMGVANGQAAAAANAMHDPMVGVNIPNQKNFGFNDNARGDHSFVNKPLYRIPGPPETVVGQRINTVFAFSSLAYICLQGYWGNPIFMWGCGSMTIKFILMMYDKFGKL